MADKKDNFLGKLRQKWNDATHDGACYKKAMRAMDEKDSDALRAALSDVLHKENFVYSNQSVLYKKAVEAHNGAIFSALHDYIGDPNIGIALEVAITRMGPIYHSYSLLEYAIRMTSKDAVTLLAADPRTHISSARYDTEALLNKIKKADMPEAYALVARRVAAELRNKAEALEQNAQAALPPAATPPKRDLQM